MREWVSLHVGQAGCQIGDVSWQLFCQEQGIGRDGIPASDDFGHTFFSEKSGRVAPRAAFVDTELALEMRGNPVYAPDSLLSGTSDAGNVFARGKNLELAKRVTERFVVSDAFVVAIDLLHMF